MPNGHRIGDYTYRHQTCLRIPTDELLSELQTYPSAHEVLSDLCQKVARHAVSGSCRSKRHAVAWRDGYRIVFEIIDLFRNLIDRKNRDKLVLLRSHF